MIAQHAAPSIHDLEGQRPRWLRLDKKHHQHDSDAVVGRSMKGHEKHEQNNKSQNKSAHILKTSLTCHYTTHNGNEHPSIAHAAAAGYELLLLQDRCINGDSL